MKTDHLLCCLNFFSFGGNEREKLAEIGSRVRKANTRARRSIYRARPLMWLHVDHNSTHVERGVMQ